MSINKSIFFLIVSALLILPGSITRAGDIDVQTNSTRVTVGKDGSINIIESKSPGVVFPNHRLPNSVYRHQYWPIRNRTSNRNTWIKKTTQCNGSSYSHQSTQTSASGRRVGQTNTSTSTTVCR